jgi:hypothetical protein
MTKRETAARRPQLEVVPEEMEGEEEPLPERVPDGGGEEPTPEV